MKRTVLPVLIIVCALIYAAESCQKSAGASTTNSQSLAAAISSLQAIAVGSISSSNAAADSIYVIHTCSANSTKDSVAFSSLPSNVADYLNTNYAGYTPEKAFAVTDSAGNAAGYIVIIQYNGSPVGLKFDASGSFVSVLEKKLGRDLEGCVGSDSTHTHGYDSSYHHHHGDSTDNDADDSISGG